MHLLAGGLKLMVFGMGTVFVFLWVMVIFMNLMSKCLAPFKNALMPPPPPPKRQSSGGDDANLAAVAAAAVELFRNRK